MSGRTGSASLVVVSNRGPLSFHRGDDGELRPSRGGGGLVSGLTDACRGIDAVWVCAALSEDDRAASGVDHPLHDETLGSADRDHAVVRLLPIDSHVLDAAYNGIANSTLWFVHHHLDDSATTPVFDATWREQWRAFETYSATFADAVADVAAPRAAVLVQDYHLVLLPGLLRERRPDLRVAHFSHTPWATPDVYRSLPDDVAAAVLDGVLAADHIGFHSPRWAEAFLACARELRGVDARARTSVHPLGVDADAMRSRAAQPDVLEALAELDEEIGDRLLVTRVDRTELSKNVLRGLLAYAHLLRTRPQWRRRVVHFALAYPSRTDLPAYRAYTQHVREVGARLVAEFAQPGWTPLLLEVRDDYARSLAAMRRADVALVNPVRDGMNLVAKETQVLGDRSPVLVLSREAGAADELGGDALLVNPYDVVQTAEALHVALSMPAAERQRRAAALAEASAAVPPATWVARQLRALDELG